MSMNDIVSISVSRNGTLPSGGEIFDGWDDDGWDIDRWENDGGRSLGLRQDRVRGEKSMCLEHVD